MDNLFGEFYEIISAEPHKKREIRLSLTLKTPEHFFEIPRVIGIDMESDFVNSITDHISVTFQMLKGDFFKYIVPEKENLTAIITIATLGKTLKGRFKAHIDDRFNIKSEQAKTIPGDILNQSLIEVGIECIEETILNMKNMTIDGVFPSIKPEDENPPRVTVTDVILGNLSVGTGPIIETFAAFGFGVKMVPADNTRAYEHIIVPTGTKLLGLPHYLQEKYGVYNGNINIYKRVFDTTTLYIYPPHRSNMLKFMEDTLQIIGVNEQRLKGIDSTYIKDGSTIKIMIVREAKINDSDKDVKNRGIRIKATEADTIVHRPLEITPDEVKVKASDIISKTQHRELKSGDTPVVNGGVTNNHYRLRSRVLQNDGTYLQIVWNHSNTRLLKPMMGVTYYEQDGNKVVNYEGLLHKIHTVYDNNKQVEHAVLFIFLKHKERPNRPQLSKLLG